MRGINNFIARMKKIKGFEAIAFSAVTAFVMITAAWLPLLFDKSASGGDITLLRRFEIFEIYASGDKDGYIISRADPEQLLKRQINLCERKYRTLAGDFVPDNVHGFAESGGEYYKLTVENGDSIYLWHISEEWTGDWENRLELFMDAETSDLYRFYYNGECVADPELYADAGADRDFEYAAARLQKVIEYGRTLSGEDDTVVFDSDGEEIKYSVRCDYTGESARVSVAAIPPGAED